MKIPTQPSSAESRFRAGGLTTTGPNNFGPTLLIALGFMSAPIGLGIPLLLLGLAHLRTSHGASAFPLLASAVQ